MILNQILKEIEKQAKEWEAILKGKRKPNPNPDVHPGKYIQDLLEQAYHHPEFPRELNINKRCDELYEEVTATTPTKWPSLEYNSTPKKVIGHIYNFVNLFRKSIKGNIEPDDETYHSPTELAKRFHIPQKSRGAFRKSLGRLRQSNDDCYMEKAQRKPREAQFLYKIKYARPIAEKIRNKSS